MEKTIQAGEKQVGIFQQMIKFLTIPIYIYFIGIPIYRNIWMPLLPKWLTGYEPELPVFGPELENGSYLTGWTGFFIKWTLFSLCASILIMVLIWIKQESLLYVPSQPIQFVEQNPARYRSPTDRGMLFKELKLKTTEGLKLQGWFIY